MPQNTDTPIAVPIRFLGSGSSGNSIAIDAPDGVILVDAGFSAKETLRRLGELDIEPSRVQAIVVTHEHGDHVRGVRVLAKRLSVPVYSSSGTRRAAALDRECANSHVLIPAEATSIAGADVIAFRTSHDTVDPIGVRVEMPWGVITVVTDTGEITDEAREAMRDSSVLAVECNHDIEMLNNGPYPWFLKQRILSSRGHLSNVDAASAIAEACHDSLTAIYALHLSEANNVPRHVRASVDLALERIEHPCRVRVVGPSGCKD
ncbi:MAG: MBL fold metallo-hydrolase [Actinomycetota bacterium]|jgi:phosphoribosyl 1,2-cyclic phosphodiesterase|nr:MBL fold metallo-hydrolase [Actinomycetota bacterium]